jgi:VanZ family protein
VSNKKTALFFLILAILMVLFFTFQNPEQSRDLSEAVRSWLGSIGIDVEYKTLRSNVHILEYFIVGLAVCGFCRSRGWKNWVGLMAGCGIGVVDECMKTLLPGREFEAVDLVKDWIGVAVAGLIMLLIRKRTEAK